MQDELIRLQNELHKTIIFISHDIQESLKIGDRVAVMKDGYLVQVGTPEEIVTNPVDDYIRAFTLDVNRAQVLKNRFYLAQNPPLQFRDRPRRQCPEANEGIPALPHVRHQRSWTPCRHAHS